MDISFNDDYWWTADGSKLYDGINMSDKLLTRDEFRNAVFVRDNHRCIIPNCNKLAVDAHHIIERSLWKDTLEFGGYFMSNGASLCKEHHIAAEKNFFPPQYLWQILRISDPIRPKSFLPDVDYNKWGKPFDMPNRTRIKYPSTPYLPFSSQWHSPDDDSEQEAYLENVDCLLNVPLILTIKLDGSNIHMTNDHIAARNGSSADHISFDYLKALHAQNYGYLIPEGKEVFCEWLYAKHSIHYTGNLSLNNYLQVFGVYDMNQRMWGSWNDVENIAKTLGIPTVPVIKTAIYEKEWQLSNDILDVAQKVIKEGHEGVVVRVAYPFHYGQFCDHIAKFVRPNHVQTSKHWREEKIIRNIIK